MFKTILKTLALSATTLTLLSACGASDALLAVYEAGRQAGLNERKSGSGGEKDIFLNVEEDDEEYLPAVRGQVDESLLPNLSGESAEIEIEIVRKEPITDDGGLAEIEQQPFSEDAVLAGIEERLIPVDAILAEIEKQLIGEQPTAEESRAVEAQPITEVVEQPIVEPPITEVVAQPITEKDRLAELARIAEQQRIAEETRRIQADYHASGSTLTQVASIRVSGQYGDGGTVGYHHDNIYNITRSKTQDTFSITDAADKDNAIVMTVNGVEYVLIQGNYGPDEEQAYDFENTRAYDSEKTISTYFSGNGNIKEIISGKHATIQGDYVAYATDTTEHNTYQANPKTDYTMGYATIGIQTPASVVDAQTAVATYKGTGYLYTHASRGVDSIRRWMYVQMAMNVDFDADTIAGIGSERYSRNRIKFNSAPIVGNAFAGTFTMNDNLRSRYRLADNPTGQYGGNFFGPNADDLAGTMRFDGTASNYNYRDGTGESGDVGVIAVGGFRADRQ